jgi:acyl-CoA synthetase (NDP forming)
MFRQSGVIRAENFEQMIDTATAFHFMPDAVGRRLAIISGPGGPAVAAADALDRGGMRLATLTDTTIRELKTFIPEAGASFRNPVDLGVAPWGIISLYSDTLRVVDKDENVDATMVIGGGLTPSYQQEYLDLMVRLRPSLKKPCMLISMAGFVGDTEFCNKLQSAGYPLFTAPEKALAAYSKVVAYNEWKMRAQ